MTGPLAPISIQVVLPGVLAELAGGARTLQVDLPAGERASCTLAALLDALELGHPALVRRVRQETGAIRRYVNVYLDGTDVRWLGGSASTLGPGTVVQILPSVAGGSG